VLVTKHIFNSEFVCHGNRRSGLLKGVYTQYHGTEDDLEARWETWGLLNVVNMSNSPILTGSVVYK